MKIPQADDITRIMDLPLAVDSGINTPRLVAKRYSFEERQAEYYTEAAELLGLVRKEKGRLGLTAEGRRYLDLDTPQRKAMIIRKIIKIPIIVEIMAELVANDTYTLSKDEIATIVDAEGSITGSTVSRRVHTIMSWLKWIGEESDVFRVDADSVKLQIATSNRQAQMS